MPVIDIPSMNFLCKNKKAIIVGKDAIIDVAMIKPYSLASAPSLTPDITLDNPTGKVIELLLWAITKGQKKLFQELAKVKITSTVIAGIERGTTTFQIVVH